jgi:alpha-tubulin suppressor-like RCC1 family protein
MCNGGTYTLVLTTDNVLICWGTSFACGINASSYVQPLPVMVNMTAFGSKVISAISCGQHTAGALTTDKTLFTWGYSGSGERGANSTENIFYPSPVDLSSTPLAGKTISSFEYGQNHGMLQTPDGELYTWGFGYYGSLGYGQTFDRLYPQLINMTAFEGDSVTDFAVGSNHNLVLTASGKLFAWGYGFNGALGNGASANQLSPAPVDVSGVLAGKTIAKIASGDQVCVVLIAGTNEVVAWGTFYNASGSRSDGAILPYTVQNSVSLLSGETVVSISTQMWHNAVLTASGKVFMWGWQFGVWGDGSNNARQTMSSAATSGILAGKSITHVSVGWYTTHWVYSGSATPSAAPSVSPATAPAAAPIVKAPASAPVPVAAAAPVASSASSPKVSSAPSVRSLGYLIGSIAVLVALFV